MSKLWVMIAVKKGKPRGEPNLDSDIVYREYTPSFGRATLFQQIPQDSAAGNFVFFYHNAISGKPPLEPINRLGTFVEDAINEMLSRRTDLFGGERVRKK